MDLARFFLWMYFVLFELCLVFNKSVLTTNSYIEFAGACALLGGLEIAAAILKVNKKDNK